MFTTDYQHELLRKSLQPKWMERVGGLLSCDMFEEPLQPLVQEVTECWHKRRKVLSAGQFAQVCTRHGIKLAARGSCDNYDFDVKEVRQFACDRILRRQLAETHLLIDRGDFARARQTFNEAWQKFPRSGIEVTPDMLTTRMAPPVRDQVLPTGLPELDGKLGGGPAVGELGTIMAPTSGGKSSLLAFLAAQAVLQGRKVWYATLEVPEADIRRKIQRCLLPDSETKPNKWLEFGKKLAKKGARLQVFEAPPHTVSASDLDGVIPDDVELILVDYADYLRTANDNPGLSYENLGSIYTSLKQIAMRRKNVVWTASQVNRSAYEAEEIYVQHVESSLKKGMICDIAVSINQSRNEMDIDPKTGNCNGRFFIAKNRAGERYVSIPFTVNWSSNRFTCGTRA